MSTSEKEEEEGEKGGGGGGDEEKKKKEEEEKKETGEKAQRSGILICTQYILTKLELLLQSHEQEQTDPLRF